MTGLWTGWAPTVDTRSSAFWIRPANANENVPSALVISGLPMVANGAGYGNGVAWRTISLDPLPVPDSAPLSTNGLPNRTGLGDALIRTERGTFGVVNVRS